MIRGSVAGFYLSFAYIPLTVFKIASVRVYLDHVARYIEHVNHSIVSAAEKLGVANCGTILIPQPPKQQRVSTRSTQRRSTLRDNRCVHYRILSDWTIIHRPDCHSAADKNSLGSCAQFCSLF
jgi:hypothetical protein